MRSFKHDKNDAQYELEASTNAAGGIEITATVLLLDGDESFYDVSFRTVDGIHRSRLVGRELFQTPKRVVEQLLKAHADLGSDPIKQIATALQNKSTIVNWITRKTGWQDRSFVLPGRTIGPSAEKKLMFDSSAAVAPALGLTSGSRKEWSDGLKEAFEKSDYLVFTASLAAASSLLDVVGETEGVVFHLHGNSASDGAGTMQRSSSGKTLAARVGASTIGRCEKNDLITFALTERGSDEICYAHHHLLAVIDEAGRVSNSNTSRINTGSLAYSLPSGVGTHRSKVATANPNLKNLKWAAIGLSTGEYPLDGILGKARPEGTQTRMIGIPVPPGAKGGIFNQVNGSPTKRLALCKSLARQVETVISFNYGIMIPKYYQRLTSERSPELETRVREIIDEFVVKRKIASEDPWERRFAEKFGIVLSGAYLMAEFGIAPWTKKRARIAIGRIYKKARAACASIATVTDTLVERLRRNAASPKRFPLLQKGTPVNTADAWGFVKIMSGVGDMLVIKVSKLDKLVKPSSALSLVQKELDKRGLVVKSSDGKLRRQVMIPGLKDQRTRFLCLHVTKLMSTTPKP